MAESLQIKEQQPTPGPGSADTPEAQANYDRRREQVRRAQKKHREKKENHCRMLENELYRLYHLITVKEELQTLQFENEILRDIMARHSIALPMNVPLQEPVFAEVTFTSNGADGLGQYLQVKLPECQSAPIAIAQVDQQPSGVVALGGVDAQPSSHDGHLSVATTEFSKPKDQIYHHSCINLAQIGIDFVLSLERPCLSHTRVPISYTDTTVSDSLCPEIQTNPPDPLAPSGHALSMQGILLSGGPQNLQSNSVWEVPARQLEKLFELSGFLGLDGYVTPVQVWNRVIGRLELEQILDGRLEMLRDGMVPHVKCYGFGALIEEDLFEDLFQCIYGE